MEICEKTVFDYIENFYIKNYGDIILTKRIKEGIYSAIINKDLCDMKMIESFLKNAEVIDFIRERQPYIKKVPDSVMENIKVYFNKQLPMYEVLSICRKSNHPEDSNIYSVVAKKNDEFACWTSWNEMTTSLNHGHYGMGSEEAAMGILREHFYDITGESEKYGIDVSKCSVWEKIETMEDNTSTMNFSNVRRRGGR